MTDELSFGEQKHRDFIDTLINDESVRSDFEQNPLEVLHRFGIGYDPAHPPEAGQQLDPARLAAKRDDVLEVMDENAGVGQTTPHPMTTRNCPDDPDD